MTALDAVSVYLPAARLSVEELAEQLELPEIQVKLFRRFHGLADVRYDPSLSLTELLLNAARSLPGLAAHRQRIRYVLWGRAFPVVVPYPVNPLHEVCRELGLDHALAFTVTQQSCSSGLLAIELAGRLLAGDLRAGSDSVALVLTGEKGFTRDARLLPGMSLFSEGASACLVSRSGRRNRLLGYACEQRGEFDKDGGASGEDFQRDYRTMLAQVIRTALDAAGVALADIALILPHNVNVVTWQRLCLLLEFPVDRVLLDNVAGNGHVFCTDAFANHQTAVEQGRLQPGDRFLVATVGAGDGATFAAMVFEH
ncbi:MAG TPA: 3-oxoacyl-[acyl-carrier-protein] synthase III C-terminal domain-containing protein [Jatrophihabitans sp.]|nr:3-oxoacyl-[acyl-carrier-protein] synthase III C-terminal domain-containing protein [Jatrophihabitans sp.]